MLRSNRDAIAAARDAAKVCEAEAFARHVKNEDVRQVYFGVVRDPRDVAVSASHVGSWSRHLNDLSPEEKEPIALGKCRRAAADTARHVRQMCERDARDVAMFSFERLLRAGAKEGTRVLRLLRLARACDVESVASSVARSTDARNMRRVLTKKMLDTLPAIRSAGATTFRDELSALGAAECTEKMRKAFGAQKADFFFGADSSACSGRTRFLEKYGAEEVK